MWLASKVDYDSFRANQLPPSMVDLGMWYVCMLHRPIVHNYGASPTTPPSYIEVRAIVCACGHGQRDRQTDARDYNTFRVVYDSREM